MPAQEARREERRGLLWVVVLAPLRALFPIHTRARQRTQTNLYNSDCGYPPRLCTRASIHMCTCACLCTRACPYTCASIHLLCTCACIASIHLQGCGDFAAVARNFFGKNSSARAGKTDSTLTLKVAHLRFFKMVPKNLDLRCVLHPPSTVWCWVKNTSRIQNQKGLASLWL